ncbi:MAG: glycosyltransferase [Segetibacter sp.]
MDNANNNLAILLSCFNRKEKTLACLKTVFSQLDNPFKFIVYLMDNGSDGTSAEVRELYPDVQISYGNSSIFWAGSMRRVWQLALNTSADYDFFLLLNDDTFLVDTALNELMSDVKKLGNTEFILVGSTLDPDTKLISYGGRLLLNNYSSSAKLILPNNNSPQVCHLGNANIMLVPEKVVKKLGVLSDSYTQQIADFDYTLRARKIGIPSFIASKYLGSCENDHGNNWWPAKQYTLTQRIEKLYDVKGLAYKEYLAYIKLHFPYYLPHAFLMLWAKTFFPFLWEKYKKRESNG